MLDNAFFTLRIVLITHDERDLFLIRKAFVAGVDIKDDFVAILGHY